MYTSKGFFRAYTSPLHPPVREWEPRNQMVAPGDLNPYLKDKKINKELYPVINVSDCGFAIEVPNNGLYKFFSKISKIFALVKISCQKHPVQKIVHKYVQFSKTRFHQSISARKQIFSRISRIYENVITIPYKHFIF